MRRALVLVAVLLSARDGLCASSADAGAPSEASRLPSSPVRVVAAGGVPFLVETAPGGVGGLSVDVWREVAARVELSQHSSMSDRVNIGLLELAENGTLTRLVARWLPE